MQSPKDEGDVYVLAETPKYKWECLLRKEYPTFSYCVETPPNWFHRKMQELCFGFKWRKIQ